jgi:hypothetical protein
MLRLFAFDVEAKKGVSKEKSKADDAENECQKRRQQTDETRVRSLYFPR